MLALILLALSLRSVDWSEIGGIVRSGRIEYLLLAAAILMVSYFVRSLRWRTLLSAEKSIPPLVTYWGVWIGYLGNSVLPARAGELLRSVMIGRHEKIDVSFALATTLTERIMDAGVLVLVVLISLSTMGTIPDWLTAVSKSMAVLAIVGIVGVLIAPHLEGFIQRTASAVLLRLRLSQSLTEKITGFITQFLLGIRALQHPGRAGSFAVLTVLAWFIDVGVAICIGQAFGIALTVPQALLVLAALGLASAAPSTPGYVGIYQAVAVTVLPPFGYTNSQAVVFVVALQFVSYVMDIIFGALAFWRLNTSHAKLSTLLQEKT